MSYRAPVADIAFALKHGAGMGEALTRGLIAKLLRPPTVRLKEDAGTPRGERNASALRDLFDLP